MSFVQDRRTDEEEDLEDALLDGPIDVSEDADIHTERGER